MMQRPSRDDDTIAASSPPPAESLVMSSDTCCRRQVLAGRYELLCLVGVGGMGNVYRARDTELDEIVAIKALRREISDKPGMLERFRREVRLSRRVTHPNVARVFDIGEHEGEKFLSMEFVDGESLAAILSREGRLGIERAVELVRDVCAGLAAAHRAGVIHRDLKPDNVLVAKDGRVVLTDFGIARAFEPGDGGQTVGMTLGTPAYMAPEQVEGREDIDGRADIYALGAMLFEIFTGDRAWIGDGPFAVAAARLIADPPDPKSKRPDLPDAFARLILKCMARSRDARFATADLVAAELSSLTQPASAVSPALSSVRERAGAAPLPSSRPGDKVVAVLPFRNQGAPDDEYLADELTDDLIDTLSMTRGIKVRPRGLLARWKGTDEDPREIGREVGAQVVVGGSVRRRAGAVRISARLISVADGFQLWAHALTRPEGDVLRLNDEVAQAIVEALTLDTASAPVRHVASDPVALDLYLRGRREYRQFWPQSQRRAIELFEQALARAPDDPMMLSAYAASRARLWFFTGEGGEAAAQAAERAVAAAPELGEAHLALATVRFQGGDMPAAIRTLKRALAYSPGLAEAHSQLGVILMEAGAVEEGRRRIEAALSLDADVPLAHPTMARAEALLGRWDAAERIVEQATWGEGKEHLGVRLRLAFWRRDEAAAMELGKRFPADGDRSINLGIMRTLVDRQLPSERGAFDSVAVSPSTAKRRLSFMWQIEAEIAGFLRRNDALIHALRRAADEGLVDLLWLEGCPLLEEARARPEYAAIHGDVKARANEILAAYREA